MNRLVLLAMLTLAIVGGAAFAQRQSDDCGCSAALAKDVISTISSDRQQYAFLNVIDQRTFEEVKKNSSSGFFAAIPIVGALIDSSSSWNEFQQKRTSYFQQIQYSGSRDQEFQQLQIVTSTVAYPAWSECMRACARNKQGLFAWKTSEDRDSVLLIIYYHGAPGARRARVDSAVLGGSVDGAPSGRVFPRGATIENNGSLPAIIKRSANATIKATFAVAGYAADPILSEISQSGSSSVAKLKLERPAVVETPVGPLCQISEYSADRHEADCPRGGPCSPGNQWGAAQTSVTLTATPGHFLRNARFERCWGRVFSFNPPQLRDVEGRGECAFTQVDSITFGAGEKTVTGVFRSWSRPIKRGFCADHIRRDEQAAQEVRDVRVPGTGKSFVFEVPIGFTSARLEYHIDGKQGILSAGDKRSADGVLTLVTKISGQGATAYQYEITGR
jgi:hypothetical protein